jgi:hypothetical protein
MNDNNAKNKPHNYVILFLKKYSFYNHPYSAVLPSVEYPFNSAPLTNF